MTVHIEFETEQEAQRVLYLLHQDLAKSEGSVVLAQQTLDAYTEGEKVGGHKREQAEKTLRSAPKHIATVRAAQKAVRAGLEASR